MTPPHTPESLLALTKSLEGLEQLRIIAAPYDNWIKDDDGWWECVPEMVGFRLNNPPNYPTSLDAIFAAEERLGLHDLANTKLRRQWEEYAVIVAFSQNVLQFKAIDLAFIPPPLRLIPFILTAQWKEQNQ